MMSAKPKKKQDTLRQLKEFRETHRKKWEEEKKLEVESSQQESSTQDDPGTTSQPAKDAKEEPNGAVNERKRKLVSAGSDDDVEFVGQTKSATAKRVKADAPDEQDSLLGSSPRITASSSLSGSPRRFPTPRLLLTRTPGRAHPDTSPANINNTITFQEIMGPDKGRGLGIKAAWFYAFFIAQDEFWDELPLDGGKEIEIYVGRDINQDPLAHQLAASLSIPFREENGNRPLPPDQYRKLVAACQEDYRKTLGDSYHACYPRMADTGGKFTGCAHSKFGIIQFEDFIRVFITSSNFMSLDFVYSDNHWFVVDFPLVTSKRKKGTPAPDFEQELFEHATLLGCPSSFIKALYGKYDYSSVEDRKVKIVTSIPGSHSGESALMYGALRLREVVRPFVQGHRDLNMEICTASIGGMQHDWLRAMYHAFTGGEYDNEATQEIPKRFRVTFPSRSDVDASRSISRQGASQIGSHFKWQEGDKVIKNMFHHYKSKDQAPGDSIEGETGQGCLFHQKFYMAMPDGTAVTDNATRPLWIYVGSANFTKAAWGKIYLDKRKAKKDPGCRRLAEGNNFEIGVVVPGDAIQGMLEPGSAWHDLVPHERNGKAFTGGEKPYNSEAWVISKTDRGPF